MAVLFPLNRSQVLRSSRKKCSHRYCGLQIKCEVIIKQWRKKLGKPTLPARYHHIETTILGQYTVQLVLSGRILLEQSFTARKFILTATSATAIGRRCYSSPQQCYLFSLHTTATRLPCQQQIFFPQTKSPSHQLTTDEILQHLILVTLKLTSFTSDCNEIERQHNSAVPRLTATWKQKLSYGKNTTYKGNRTSKMVNIQCSCCWNHIVLGILPLPQKCDGE